MRFAACPLFLIVPFLTILGIVLMVQGLRRRRHGQTPHCRQCGYNLTGLTSDKCSECGSPLQPDGIVIGEGGRSKALVIGGLLCLMPCVGLLAIVAVNTDWYPYYPTGWLISDARSNVWATANKAWGELNRRIKAGKLSATQQSLLIDACLQEQSSPSRSAVDMQMLDHLGAELAADKLSPAQKETFFKQAVKLKLTARPKVILGDQVPYTASDTGRTSGSPLWAQVEKANVAIDGKIIQPGISQEGTCSGIEGLAQSGGTVKVETPGRHTLSFDRHVTFYTGTFGDKDKSVLLRKLVIPLKADFEVLPAAPPGLIKPIRNPAFATQIQSCITPKDLKFQTRPSPQFSWSVHIDNLPTTIAFEILVRVNGAEYPVGTIYHGPGGSVHWSSSTNWWGEQAAHAPPAFATCDVIFRGSESVARNTVDLFEYWDGELVYKNMPVASDAPTTQSTQPAGSK